MASVYIVPSRSKNLHYFFYKICFPAQANRDFVGKLLEVAQMANDRSRAAVLSGTFAHNSE